MNSKKFIVLILICLNLSILACQAVTGLPNVTPTVQPTATPTYTPLPLIPVIPGETNPDEPVFITGNIPYTSPFFIDTLAEPFVLLEDQAGFVMRDRDFKFSLAGQTIGPVELNADMELSYQLSLPAIPQGVSVDVDNDNHQDLGVQVFAIAYWSNTWGGPFLEERDGMGWSNAYVSTITDPNNEDEITGGALIVWASDDKQGFPTGFGEDGLLFTEDDPVALISAGYSLVDLDNDPFRIYKETRPVINLNEGDIAVNDYSTFSYQEAFEALYQKISKEYPFTDEKGINWGRLYDEFEPRIARVRNKEDFYLALRDFTWKIPDGHVGISLDTQLFFNEHGGGYGLVLAELSDGKVVASHIIPNSPADNAGIEPGAEIITWDRKPITEAISEVKPYFGPYSTAHHERIEQIAFLTHTPPDIQVQIEYRNPGRDIAEDLILEPEREISSLLTALPYLSQDRLSLPLSGEVLDGVGLGYIRINTFSADYNLMAQLWDRYLNTLIDIETPGLILDLRLNSGGSTSLAFDFAGYFIENQVTLYQRQSYNEKAGEFKNSPRFSKIKPAPSYYGGHLAILVSPYCISACEAFAYALSQDRRATVIGHFPTAGAYGEVGRGQYRLPDELTMQFPTSRSITLDGELVIEGVGVVPDILVPVTFESAMGQVDAVLEAAINYLTEQIKE